MLLCELVQLRQHNESFYRREERKVSHLTPNSAKGAVKAGNLIFEIIAEMQSSRVRIMESQVMQWFESSVVKTKNFRLHLSTAFNNVSHFYKCTITYIQCSYWQNGYIFVVIRSGKSVKCIRLVYKTFELCYSWGNCLDSMCRICLWQEGMIKDSLDMYRSMLKFPAIVNSVWETEHCWGRQMSSRWFMHIMYIWVSKNFNERWRFFGFLNSLNFIKSSNAHFFFFLEKKKQLVLFDCQTF